MLIRSSSGLDGRMESLAGSSLRGMEFIQVGKVEYGCNLQNHLGHKLHP
jgi:hypothetical protein